MIRIYYDVCCTSFIQEELFYTKVNYYRYKRKKGRISMELEVGSEELEMGNQKSEFILIPTCGFQLLILDPLLQIYPNKFPILPSPGGSISLSKF